MIKRVSGLFVVSLLISIPLFSVLILSMAVNTRAHVSNVGYQMC